MSLRSRTHDAIKRVGHLLFAGYITDVVSSVGVAFNTHNYIILCRNFVLNAMVF